MKQKVKEERKVKEGYRFSILRHNYIIATQIECCLQESLIEASMLSFECSFVIDDYYYDKLGMRKIDNRLLDYVREYFRYLLPWPKTRNNLLRAHITNIIKYFACFSREFVSISYQDGVNRTPKDIKIKTAVRRVCANPNLKFLDSNILLGIRKDMEKAFCAMPDFLKLVKVFMYVEFDPSDRPQVRFLSMLLSLPVLGGYDRADKYLATPHSEEDRGFEDADISREMYDVVRQLHSNATKHGYHPLEVREWERATLGFMKSTSAAEKVKIIKSEKTLERDALRLNKMTGSKTILTGSSKAIVGIIKGSKIFTSDFHIMYDNVDNALSTGSRNVPVKATRAIFPVPLTVLAYQLAVYSHI